MSVSDRAWFYKSTSDDFTNRISKYFDSFEKKEKQMFEESWNPIFGQSLKWNPQDGLEIEVELVTKKEVDELKSQVKVLEENYNKLLDRIAKENIPEMEAPKFSFDKSEGSYCKSSEIDTTPIQEDDEAKFEDQLKDLDTKTLEETFPQNPPDARSRTINHKAYHTIEDMWGDIYEDLDTSSEDFETLAKIEDRIWEQEDIIKFYQDNIAKANDDIKNLKRKIVSDYLSSGKTDTIKTDFQFTNPTKSPLDPTKSPLDSMKNSEGTTLSQKISDIVSKELEKFEKLPPLEISIPEGATLSCRSEPNREIKITYHKDREWISCENALPKEGVTVELKRVNHEGIEQIKESIRTKICQKIAFESKIASGSLFFYPHLDKSLCWRPLPQDSLLDVLSPDSRRFSIGDQVIGLAPDNTIVIGTIESIKHDIPLTYDGAKEKCPIYLTVTEKRYSDSWLDARRTVKLTPELKEEIDKILA